MELSYRYSNEKQAEIGAVFGVDYSTVSQSRARLKAKMNFPAASHGVSMKDKFNPNAASCGELNPADFAISTSHSL
jgi:hypothetical protein